MGITISVSGTLITGRPISFSEYIARTAKTVASAMEAKLGPSEEMNRLVAESSSAIVNGPIKGELFLCDAYVISASGEAFPSWDQPGVVVAVRVDRIDSVLFGQVGHGKPSQS